MPYVAKEIKGNVNVSSKSPLKELASLLVSILGILLIIYIVLGFAVNAVVPRLPEEFETRLEKFYTSLYIKEIEQSAAEKEIQALLNRLVEKLDTAQDNRVHIVESKKTNALALPGRNILVFTTLLKEIDSQNELSFVLAHELGHFAHRDHLKALGRSLIFFILSTVFTGQDSSVSNFLGNSLAKAEMKFSQGQEKAADSFAVDLLNKRYGHVSGAVEFLERIKDKEKAPKFLYFFATHPHPENRIKAIEKKINQEGYRQGPLLPLFFFDDGSDDFAD